MGAIAVPNTPIVLIRRHVVALGLGGLLAVTASVLAPSSALLAAPDAAVEYVLAALVLGGAFALGYAFPQPAFFGLVAVAVIEGAVRKWVLNDVVVFLVKDFLALGIYAAVLPGLRREEWRRPWWLLAPLGGIVLLVILYMPRAGSWSQAVIGLRGWTIYVPLLWVAPRLLATRARTLGLVLLVLVAGIFEAIFAAVQSLSGNAELNKLLPGTLPPLVTDAAGAVSYLRPSGTMLQVGAFAVLILFAVLCAYALVAATSRRTLVALGAAAPAALIFAIVYAGGRALFLGVAGASVALAAYLIWRRRFGAFAAVVVSVAAGYLILAVQPYGGANGDERQRIAYTVLDEEGRVLRSEVEVGAGAPRGGYVSRATAIEQGDVGAVPSVYTSTRIRNQLLFVKDQPVVGHGTGTMTLGSEYVLPGRRLAAESVYAKAAYELGLPGFVLLAWLFGALIVATAVGAVMTLDWRRAAALVGFGAACVIPVWCVFNFTLDMPIAAILYWSFAGIATAWASPFRIHRR
jgi:hypothetical protein